MEKEKPATAIKKDPEMWFSAATLIKNMIHDIKCIIGIIIIISWVSFQETEQSCFSSPSICSFMNE